MAKKFRENVEIISSAAGQSGLNLKNLPSGTAQSTFNGILGINAAGDVIKIDATKISTVTVWAIAPTSPVAGQQWLDTSVSPSELKVWNGSAFVASNDEVQHYANLATFPAVGNDNILYVDDATDLVYVWDSTTSTYKNASGTGTWLFSITDGTTTQSVGVGETITFNEGVSVASVLNVSVSATDTVTLSAVAGHTVGQAIVSNGTNLVYQTVGRKFPTTVIPVVNVAQTVTHWLATTDIIVQAYDITSNELVSVEVTNRTANTVDITSTTTDHLRIIVIG